MHLSIRAQRVANTSEDAVIWRFMSNLWGPEDNPDGYISFGVAENRLMHDELSKHIHDNINLSHKEFAYSDSPSGSKQLKKAISDFLNRYLKPVRPLEHRHVSVTNKCSSAIEHLSWALVNEGEAFFLRRPYYGMLYPDLTLRFGNKIVTISFHDIDPLSDGAIDAYERYVIDSQANGQKVSGIIISHPHSPLGRCYPHQVLVGLMKLCGKYKLHLISDEIYALSSNPILHDALVPVGVYSQVSSLSEHLTINMLQYCARVETNRKRLSKMYRIVVEWARGHDIEYAHGINAAFFVWVNLGQFYRRHHLLAKTADLAGVVEQRLLERRIFVASGKDFAAENNDWFRILFGQDSNMGIAEALEYVTIIKAEMPREDRPGRLTSQHQLILAYLANGQTEEEEEEEEEKRKQYLVAIRMEVLTEDYPDRLSSQYEPGITYNVNEETEETVKLLEYFVTIRSARRRPT
ncbi:pyridoxal phosphate-dependent transferase [Penicillium odoratum]|uniref:pyridoxal phosphate-dependent transferase n=1 Tax=Penicillium odoratum TaxID=1167516 RepID=UPI00254814CD|nr:pyridoxal phosphate-dependent transferase [Penicillium odoratum]KAJ5776872.1 pyridoxal phosphate-dependent transferase [Penicillium odoratum]